MFTRRLQSLLASAISGVGYSHTDPADIEERFERLRGSGKFPTGTRKNVTHLTTEQVALGLLSLVSRRSGYAAVASANLAGLMPVGGIPASFGKSATFGDAIISMLDGKVDIRALLEVRISESVIYTNAHCRAAIVYRIDDQIKTAYYVSRYAVSKLGPGAEKDFSPYDLISPVVVDMAILPRLIASLAQAISDEKRFGVREVVVATPIEDEEEEKQRSERIERLGLTSGSQFFNLGVDGQVGWPRKETLVEVDGKHIVLLPATIENATSLHIDLHRNRMEMDQARTFASRFLSMLSWCDDAPAVLQDGWAGNPVPVPVSRRRLAQESWAGFYRKVPANDEIRIALALYRQGCNAEDSFLVSYAVLSFYKIIELAGGGKNGAKNWMRDNYEKMRSDSQYKEEIAAFDEICAGAPPHEYLFKSCRNAVAHAIGRPTASDPDDTTEVRRLHIAASLLHGFARLYISQELGLSDSRFDGT
jgi:hypothetical protein